jgi:Transposase, Mutator family
MLASPASEWPHGGGWVLEPKYDGYRLNPLILRLMQSGRAVFVENVKPKEAGSCVVRDQQTRAGHDGRARSGVTLDGDRDVLGMWFQESEGAKFWMQVLTDLKTRGVQDILICCLDGLTGFPEAIEAIFPKTTVRTCVVHLIRASLKYVPRRDREQVARDLKLIYRRRRRSGSRRTGAL